MHFCGASHHIQKLSTPIPIHASLVILDLPVQRALWTYDKAVTVSVVVTATITGTYPPGGWSQNSMKLLGPCKVRRSTIQFTPADENVETYFDLEIQD